MKQFRTATALTALFVLLTGGVFPGLVWILAQTFFPYQANGSLLRRTDGSILGSEIIGQPFTQAKYFHPRPSAAGAGYDAANSAGTNLGPTSAKLINGLPDNPQTPDADESFPGLKELAAQYRKENKLDAGILLPSDAVTRSASGLDPDISPANALLQSARVASARGMSVDRVQKLVKDLTQARFLGIFGERHVNVLRLNLALDAS